MGWGNGFKKALRQPITSPLYELRFHENPNMPTNSGGFSIYGGTGAGPIKSDDLQITREGPQIEGTSVIPNKWNVTLGGFSVQVMGDIRKYELVRGLFAGLFVEINGYKERVCFGQLRSISGVFGVYRLNFVDIVSALAVNADATVDTTATMAEVKNRWFYKTGVSAKLTAPFNAGDTTFQVDELANFENETGEDGWCLIDGDATTASGQQSHGQIYATWNSKSAASGAGTLTTTAETRAGNTIYPGTAANLSSGQLFTDTPIKPVAMLQGDPWDIMAKLLHSNLGSGGPFDTYPASFTANGGFGSDLFDYFDAKEMRDYVRSASSVFPPSFTSGYSWMIPVTDPWQSGLRTFVNLSSQTGQWPVWRQDSLSWRACIPLNFTNLKPTMTITSQDVIAFESIELFDPNVENVYQAFKITYQLLNDTDQVSVFNRFNSAFYGGVNFQPTIPSLPFQSFDNKFIYASSTQTSDDTNRDRMARGDTYRMFPWSKNLLTKIVLRVPLFYAELCAGDIVECIIDAKYISSFRGNTSFWQFKAMVTAINYSFQDAFCNLTIHTYEDL